MPKEVLVGDPVCLLDQAYMACPKAGSFAGVPPFSAITRGHGIFTIAPIPGAPDITTPFFLKVWPPPTQGHCV